MTATTKSGPKASAPAGSVEAHRQREAEAAARYPKARSDAEAAAARIPDLVAAVEAAEDRVAEIKSGWTRGDDRYTAADLTTAQADVERASALLAGAQSVVEGHEQIEAPGTDVAEAVAEIIRSLLPFVPVIATTVAPVQEAAGESAVYVVQSQRRATKDWVNGGMKMPKATMGDGIFSGEVTIVTGLDGRFRDLDGDALAAKAKALGWRIEVSRLRAAYGQATEPGVLVWSEFRVKVEAAHHNVPRIKGDLSAAAASAFGQAILGQATHGRSMIAREDSHVVTVVRDGDVRRATVEVVLSYIDNATPWDRYATGSIGFDTRPISGNRAARSAAESVAGTFVRSLGRIESVEITGAEPRLTNRHRVAEAIKVTAVAVSAAQGD